MDADVANPEIEAQGERLEQTQPWRELLSVRSMTSALVSFVFHVVLIVVLSLLVALLPAPQNRTLIVSTESGDAVAPEDLDQQRIIVTDASRSDASSSLVPIEPNSSLELPADQLLQGDSTPTMPQPDWSATSRAECAAEKPQSAGRWIPGAAG